MRPTPPLRPEFAPPLDLAWVRAQFPALADGTVFMDNAGGGQVLRTVAERIADYLLHTNVIHGAPNAVSRRSEARALETSARMAMLMNAADPTEVVMGPSSTQLEQNLARPASSACSRVIGTTGICGSWKSTSAPCASTRSISVSDGLSRKSSTSDL